ncbi:ABC transporter ATP-binding protein [Polluticaenibacter yanchengensis]|uniref:ABC transporter ATP-binding protein n=1 Tax=Polluticaenibacter yanchengensis TaxID=3014562 RepID=A0ABT4UGB1_9BACT|nr:ABC transporter ATP-binding protein [Chitinophagaceae bacterium LY-5]
MKHLRTLNKYFWKYRVRLISGLFFIVLSNYFNVIAPKLTAYIVDKVQTFLPSQNNANVQFTAHKNQTDYLVNSIIGQLEQSDWTFSKVVSACAIIILILAILRGLFMFFMRQTIIVMSRHIEYDLKNDIYKQYQALDASFYKKHAVGDLMNRISEDVSRVRMYFGPAIMQTINILTIIIFCLYNMFQKSAVLTWYVLAPLPVLAVIIYFVNAIISRKSEKIQALLSDVTTNAQQSYSGIRVIKSYVQEHFIKEKFNEQSNQYRQSALSLAKVEALYFPANVLLIGISTLVALLVGALFYHKNLAAAGAGLVMPHPEITPGTIAEFILYLTMLSFPFSAIGWVTSIVQRAVVSQRRINEFLLEKPGIADNDIKPQFDTGSVAVSLKNVDYIYENTGIHALKNVSLEIPAKSRVAILGKTGSGKSTLANVIMRQYEINDGTILFNDKDITNYGLQYHRQLISNVPQEVFLFSDTVRQNIAFGSDRINDDDVIAAAKNAVIHEEILKFQNGYDTVVGERGVTLSGGQKQRISIARAILKEAPVVIFDDCLSAVDAKTEQAIIKNLDEYLTGKTAFIITHRIFSSLNFDEIIVMNEGQIVERGNHETLLALNGEYARMYHQQVTDAR